MRQRISEKNRFPVFDLETEYKKLQALFLDNSEFGRFVGPIGASKARPSMSYNDCLRGMFLEWNLRGSFTSLEEMMFGLGISEDDFENNCSEERMLDYIQFLLNAIIFVKSEIKKGNYNIYQAGNSVFNAIVGNSTLILDNLGAEILDDPNEIVIAYKDDIATVTTLQHPDLSVSITEYLKIDNRGDLQKKGEILCTLAKKLEPLESKFKGTELNSIYSDTTMLLNKMGARHSLNEKDKIEAKFLTMDNVELEEWYDRAFQMFLACMAVYPYIIVKDEIKTIKN